MTILKILLNVGTKKLSFANEDSFIPGFGELKNPTIISINRSWKNEV